MSKGKWLIISVFFDALLINVGIILAFLLRFAGKLPFFNFRAYTNLAIFITLIHLVSFYIYDLYNIEKTQSGWDTLYLVFKAVTLSIILTVGLTFFYRFFSFPRTVFALSWFLVIVLITSWRLIITKVFKIKWPIQRILVVGAGKTGENIIQELKNKSQWGYKVVGVVSRNPTEIGPKFKDIPVLGHVKDIPSLVRDHSVNRVIVTTPVRERELVEDLTISNPEEISIEVVPDLYEIFVGRVDHTLLSDIPLIKLTKESVSGWIRILKRAMDIFCAALLLILTLPLMLLTAILVKVSSSGSVFFKQERVGEGEKIFKLYKFRTMIEGAEDETGPVLATEDDPRITTVGRFLRKYRIDELPQLFNILKGDMSFVGPRPERPFFVEEFKKKIPGYAERFKIKPGVTGLAQVSGFYATTPETKLKYDLIYIYHQSIFLDVKIIFHTLRIVLTGKGAC
jgi:exopolysaccharide biosynthesis polyprenyl glycosylphosphotransferase